MKKSFLACLLILLMLCGFMPVHAQLAIDQAHAYLDRNALSGIQELVSATEEKGILLIGEHHGVARNYKLYLHLLRHFQEERIQLVMEIPPSNAYLFNEYLKTGDESLMSACILNLRGSFAHTQENLDFWRSVKELTGNGKSFEVIGVDQEFQLKNAALALGRLDPARYQEALDRILEASGKSTTLLIQELQALIDAHQGMAADDIKSKTIRAIINSLEQMLDDPRGENCRDCPMHQMFADQVDPNILSLGIFGGVHVPRQAASPTLASLLLQDSRYKDRLAVAQIFYNNSCYLHPRSGEILVLDTLACDAVMVENAKRKDKGTVIYRLTHCEHFDAHEAAGLPLPLLYDYAIMMVDAKPACFPACLE